jgi:hypothetical protein
MEKIQTALRTFKTCIEIANVTEPRRKWLMKRYEDAIEEVKLLAALAVSESVEPVEEGTVCTCTKFRETPMINGKHICSICNKPIVQTVC